MSALHTISAGGASPKADLIFVHGLGGDAFATWWHDPDVPKDSWPFWLAEDLPETAVHSLEYEASASGWLGRSMPLTDRATNVLTRLESRGIGRRPIVFVCHSLGGLLVKQMLRHAQDTAVQAWRAIAAQTRAIVFLATPHTGSDYATWLQRLGKLARASASIDDLRAHDDHLRNLNLWYRENVGALGIATHCLFEKYPTAIGMIVDPTSADPGITGVVPRSLDADHVSICKPKSRQDLVYGYVLQQVLARLESQPEQPPRRSGADHLPADLGDFEGRSKEIERLRAILTKGGGQAAVSAIGGMGGVGKSALAVHVAHLLADEAPDGRVFVDMGGRTGTPFAAVGSRERGAPLEPVEAMIKVVALLAPERQVPKEDDAARQAYRAALDGKRVLLVLDNAEDSAQVRPLLDWRAPTTLVVITSRRTIAAPGLVPGRDTIDLGVMEPDEAADLLRTVLGERAASEAELASIAERCGRLPLALRAAGTYLANNPQESVSAYLAALADEKQRLRRLSFEDDASLDVYAALALSARRLAEEKPALEARWRQLAAFPASFDAAAAAVVWEAEADEAARDLGELRRRSMLLWDAADDRWRLHDLMRDVASVPLQEQNQGALEAQLEATRAYHSEYYLSVLWRCDALYKEKGRTVDGLALYDLEQRNIATGHAWALARIDQDDAAARLAADYANAGAYVLALRLHPRKRIDWLEAQRRACVRLGDRPGEAAALGNLGLAWADLGEPRRAIEHYERDLAIAREIGDRRGEGTTLGNLGLAWAALGEPRRAIEHYKQHLAITREIGDRRGEGNALGNLGNAWADLGELRRAIEHYEQQLKVTREIGDRMGEGYALFNSGLALDALGERDEAVRRVRDALAIREAIGARRLAEKARAKLAEWGAPDGRS